MVAWHANPFESQTSSIWRRGLYVLTASTAAFFSSPDNSFSVDGELKRAASEDQNSSFKQEKSKNDLEVAKSNSEIKLPALTYKLAPGQSAAPRLVMVGGGKIPIGATNWFGEAAGGANSDTLIVIIGLSSRYPDYYHKTIVEALSGIVPSDQIILAPHPDFLKVSIQEEHKRFVDLCRKATGIVLTGGSQQRGMDYLKRIPEAIDVIRGKYNKGTPFLGTSAGLAMLNKTMPVASGKIFSTNSADYPLCEGLGFADKETYFEQHGNRNDHVKGDDPLRSELLTTRLMRTIALSSASPESHDSSTPNLGYKRGICVHEGTALITVGDIFRVEGEKVIVYDPRCEMDVLLHGDCYNLSEGKRFCSQRDPLEARSLIEVSLEK